MNTATLAELVRHIGALPSTLRTGSGIPVVRAVVRDLFETLTGTSADAPLLDAFAAPVDETRESYYGWTLAAAHVLMHPELARSTADAAALRKLLLQELAQLSAIVKVNLLDQDEERREELCRRCVRALGQTLAGESAAEADDRLRQVDSIERHEVLKAAEEREARAREVREAMAKKAAEEAVPKVGRE